MVDQTPSKLNHLQSLLPEGLLVDSAWLEKAGYSRQLRAKYVANGWLEMPARGAYRRPVALINGVVPNASVEWERAVCSLQMMLGHPVYVGGRTSLELQGFGHYISVWRANEVHLYSPAPMPGWFSQLNLGVHIKVHRRTLFAGDVSTLTHETQPAGKSDSPNFMLHRSTEMRWPLRIASAERAILEYVDELPDHESFEQVDKFMDGLGTLSPRRLQVLLEACLSVKVKRLFLLMAERHNHAWFKRLDLKRIDLGAGKRALVENGRYNPKYQITVPEFLLNKADAL
jgi:hypothetical protein